MSRKIAAALTLTYGLAKAAQAFADHQSDDKAMGSLALVKEVHGRDVLTVLEAASGPSYSFRLSPKDNPDFYNFFVRADNSTDSSQRTDSYRIEEDGFSGDRTENVSEKSTRRVRQYGGNWTILGDVPEKFGLDALRIGALAEQDKRRVSSTVAYTVTPDGGDPEELEPFDDFRVEKKSSTNLNATVYKKTENAEGHVTYSQSRNKDGIGGSAKKNVTHSVSGKVGFETPRGDYVSPLVTLIKSEDDKSWKTFLEAAGVFGLRENLYATPVLRTANGADDEYLISATVTWSPDLDSMETLTNYLRDMQRTRATLPSVISNKVVEDIDRFLWLSSRTYQFELSTEKVVEDKKGKANSARLTIFLPNNLKASGAYKDLPGSVDRGFSFDKVPTGKGIGFGVEVRNNNHKGNFALLRGTYWW